MATLSSSPARGLAKPIAPVKTSRGVLSSSAMTSIAATFGAPVDRARREARAQQLGVAAALPQPPAHLRHEVPHAGVAASIGKGIHGDRAHLAHAPEIVADEVDDHRVLGSVLLRGGESPPLGGGDGGIGRGAAGSLDRRAAHLASVASQEQLR